MSPHVIYANEDALPADLPRVIYDFLWPSSRVVDGVRMFPWPAARLNQLRYAPAEQQVMVWLVHHRETLSNDTHAHTASSREQAEAWMRQQTEADWGGGCFTLWPSPIDGDDIADGGPVAFYSLTGQPLDEQPVDLLQARAAMLERHGHCDIPTG